MYKKIPVFLIVRLFLIPVIDSHAYVDDMWNLSIDEGEYVVMSGYHKYFSSAQINGTVDLLATDGTITLEAPRIVIGNKGIINGNGKGYKDGPGKGSNYSICDYIFKESGGGYGGRGGDGFCCNVYPPIYLFFPGGGVYGDDNSTDVQMGSGGGNNWHTRRGGGAIQLIGLNEVLIQGLLTVNGAGSLDSTSDSACEDGCGSGGGILIKAPRITLRGVLSARGGSACTASYGDRAAGGGGGRIKIFYSDEFNNVFSLLDVSGGLRADYEGATSDPPASPQDGTITIRNLLSPPFTPTPSPTATSSPTATPFVKLNPLILFPVLIITLSLILVRSMRH